MKHLIHLTVNGRPAELEVEPRESIANALRNHLNLTGTHIGCEQGACGACTVLIENEPVRGCLMFAVQAEGASVTTIEGVANGGVLTPLQQSMREHHALQCGYCTPGMVLTLQSLFDRDPTPQEEDIREAISGNLCRCTGYQPIIAAALALSAANRAGRVPANGDR